MYMTRNHKKATKYWTSSHKKIWIYVTFCQYMTLTMDTLNPSLPQPVQLFPGWKVHTYIYTHTHTWKLHIFWSYKIKYRFNIVWKSFQMLTWKREKQGLKEFTFRIFYRPFSSDTVAVNGFKWNNGMRAERPLSQLTSPVSGPHFLQTLWLILLWFTCKLQPNPP